MKEKMPIEIRLWLGLDWDKPDGECWIWKRAIDAQGYGAIGNGRGTAKVHRVVYEIAYGVQLGPEDTILHLCDNRACVNPDHLLCGNRFDNEIDQKIKLRGRFQGLSDSYARFLYEKLKRRFEGNPNQGQGCDY